MSKTYRSAYNTDDTGISLERRWEERAATRRSRRNTKDHLNAMRDIANRYADPLDLLIPDPVPVKERRYNEQNHRIVELPNGMTGEVLPLGPTFMWSLFAKDGTMIVNGTAATRRGAIRAIYQKGNVNVPA